MKFVHPTVTTGRLVTPDGVVHEIEGGVLELPDNVGRERGYRAYVEPAEQPAPEASAEASTFGAEAASTTEATARRKGRAK